MPIKHPFVSGRDDGGDPGAVQPSGWNAEHQITGMLALLDALANLPNMVLAFDGSGVPYLKPVADFATSVDANLTGTPTAPTAAPGTNTTQIATTAFVKAAIDAIIGGAPGALDTLYELATALGNDANFAAVVNAAIALRLRVDVSQGLSLAQKSQGRDNLGLGTSAVLDTGTTANKVVQLDGAAKLPAVDGSQLTNLPLNFLQAGTGAVSRTLQDKARETVTAEDFGAVGNGTTDDTAAIQAALNTGKRVQLKAKTYKVTTLNMNTTGAQLVGEGGLSGRTILTTASNNTPVINVSASYILLSGIWVTRSVTAIAGAYGVQFSTYSQLSRVDDLYVEKHMDGLALGPCDWSFCSNVISSANLNDGVRLVNLASGGKNLQWQMYNVLSQINGGRGFLVASVSGSGGASMGQWTKCATYANSGFGLAVAGVSGHPVNGFRLSDSFLGEDGNSEIYLDTYGGTHTFSNVFLEICGRSPTGPTQSTAASNIGHGMQITANNLDVRATHCTFTGNSYSGVWTAATTQTTLVSCSIALNLQYGVVAADGAKLQINSNTFSSNTSGNVSYTSNATSAVAIGNSPRTVDNYNEVATATNDNATAGSVGEYVESVVASGSAISLTSNTAANVTSISLGAGDWDVQFEPSFTGGSTTLVTYLAGSVSLASATLDQTGGRYAGQSTNGVAIFNNTPGGIEAFPTGQVRMSLSGTTTVYGVVKALFSTSTCSAFGVLRARRVR